jgi:dihydroorotase
VLDLVREGLLSPLELVRRLSTNPARILRRPGGSLARGEAADLVVVDPERRWTYDPAKGFSKSRNSPWAGRSLRGRAVVTVVAGRIVYDADRGVLVP